MPLLTLCGCPCSGKTTLTKQLIEQLQALDESLIITYLDDFQAIGVSGNGDSEGPDSRIAIYNTASKEKEMRSQLKSEVSRALASAEKNLIILDSCNYIKGFRYELFCLAKSMKQPHSVLFVNKEEQHCKEYNNQIHRYPDELLDEMIGRLEVPNANQRWDSPLFSWDESKEVGALAEEIYDSFISADRKVKPNQATTTFMPKSVDFLKSVDQVVSRVGDHILSCQSMGAQTVKLPEDLRSENSPELMLTESSRGPWNNHSMSRAKRNYISFVKTNPPKNCTPQVIASLFIRFLDSGE